MRITVQIIWDNEAAVWVATSADVPGLILESGSIDALIERIKRAVPELMSLNGKGDSRYELTFFCERHEIL